MKSDCRSQLKPGVYIRPSEMDSWISTLTCEMVDLASSMALTEEEKLGASQKGGFLEGYALINSLNSGLGKLNNYFSVITAITIHSISKGKVIISSITSQKKHLFTQQTITYLREHG